MEIDALPVTNDPRNAANSHIDPRNVPTNDPDVRLELRRLGEPVTCFGEGKPERRARLIRVLEAQPHTNFGFAYVQNENEDLEAILEDEDDEEDFYTPGTEALLEARKALLLFSLERAQKRTEKQRTASKAQNFFRTLKHRRNINLDLAKTELFGTQIVSGNTRTLSAVRFNGSGSKVAAGSWDGSVYVLNSVDLSTAKVLLLGHHTEKVSALDWDVFGLERLVTGGNEGNINVWDTSEPAEKMAPVISLPGAHSARITKTLFHPNGRFLASTSFDQTWKLWDLQRPEKELLEQEGHSKEVFSASFHPDGGLLATGGLDAIGWLWDLRSGRSIATLQSHIKGIYSMDWSDNGYHVATASGDCSVKIWDIRRLNSPDKELFSIPAHTKLVSEVRFFHKRGSTSLERPVTDDNDEGPETLSANGTFLATAGYDGVVNLWSADNFVRVKCLQGHGDKVMSCDISGDGSTVVSCGWDRSVKVWGR